LFKSAAGASLRFLNQRRNASLLVEQTWPGILRDYLKVRMHRDSLIAPACDGGNDPTKTARSFWAQRAQMEAQNIGYSVSDQIIIVNQIHGRPRTIVSGSPPFAFRSSP
jgi:hypothetical protein